MVGTVMETGMERRALGGAPVTPAAPASSALGDRPALVRVAAELALDLEGRRRAITLGGSLLWIPGAAAAVLALSAALGVRGVWLALCALAGLATGPALTTASIALLSLVGTPLVRVRFRRRARALGLSEVEIDVAWERATAELDAEVRGRLGRARPEGAT